VSPLVAVAVSFAEPEGLLTIWYYNPPQNTPRTSPAATAR
jgi:hypothetical protein